MRALMTAQSALRTILSEDASRRRGMTAQDDVGDGAALAHSGRAQTDELVPIVSLLCGMLAEDMQVRSGFATGRDRRLCMVSRSHARSLERHQTNS